MKYRVLQMYVIVENVETYTLGGVCIFICVCMCVVSLAALRVCLPVCAGGLVVSLYPEALGLNWHALYIAEGYSRLPCNLAQVPSIFPQHVFSAYSVNMKFEMSAFKSFHLFMKYVSIQNWRVWKFSSEFMTAFLIGAVFSMSTADESHRPHQPSQSCPVSSVEKNHRVDLVLPPDRRWLAL